MTKLRIAIFLILALVVAGRSHSAEYKPLCRNSSTGKIEQCTGTLDNTQAPTAPAMSGVNITTGTIGPASITGGSANRIMIDGGTTATWSNTIVGATISCASNTCTSLPAAALSGTVGVGNGGMGKSTWTVGSMPVASAATTMTEIAPGTAGQVLTSNGAGLAPSMQATVTASTANGTAGASHSLTTNAYEAIPSLSVSLTPGTYLCSANVRSTVQCSAGTGYITVKLYNVTAAADVANSERLGALCSTTGQAFVATTPITELVTVGTTSTIQAYAVSPAGATYTARDVLSDADGRSRLVCVKTAP